MPPTIQQKQSIGQNFMVDFLEMLPQTVGQLTDIDAQSRGLNTNVAESLARRYPTRQERVKEEMLMEKARLDLEQSRLANILGLEQIEGAKQSRKQSSELFPLQKEYTRQRTLFDIAQEKRAKQEFNLRNKLVSGQITELDFKNSKLETIYEQELRTKDLSEQEIKANIKRLESENIQTRINLSLIEDRVNLDKEMARIFRDNNEKTPKNSLIAWMIERGGPITDIDSLINSENKSSILLGKAMDYFDKNDLKVQEFKANNQDDAADSLILEKAKIMTIPNISREYQIAAEHDIEEAADVKLGAKQGITSNKLGVYKGLTAQKLYLKNLRERIGEEIIKKLEKNNELDKFIETQLLSNFDELDKDEIKKLLLGPIEAKKQEETQKREAKISMDRFRKLNTPIERHYSR